jgi:division protein CdvB (Snf7/Vps24/ESCRT-III family)
MLSDRASRRRAEEEERKAQNRWVLMGLIVIDVDIDSVDDSVNGIVTELMVIVNYYYCCYC